MEEKKKSVLQNCSFCFLMFGYIHVAHKCLTSCLLTTIGKTQRPAAKSTVIASTSLRNFQATMFKLPKMVGKLSN